MKCLSTKIEDMSNLISSDWIRPEDLCYYEKLCEETDNFNLSIKLVERTKSTKFLIRVVEAYARRQYKGNAPYGTGRGADLRHFNAAGKLAP